MDLVIIFLLGRTQENSEGVIPESGISRVHLCVLPAVPVAVQSMAGVPKRTIHMRTSAGTTVHCKALYHECYLMVAIVHSFYGMQCMQVTV